MWRTLQRAAANFSSPAPLILRGARGLSAEADSSTLKRAPHLDLISSDHRMLRFSNVSYRAGGTEILRDLTCEVEQGRTLVLLGRSGSGKTTALKMVNALLTPSAGEVLVEGRATTAWDPIELRRRIGYVIQETGLFPHFTVARNVGLVPRLIGWPEVRIEARVKELLDRVGLPPDEFANRFPRQLSGGQRQRVGVARALAADPPILLFDEPFGALDPVTRHEIRTEFTALARDLGKTILFVTHDIREALELGDHIGLLLHGRLEELLPASEFSKARSAEARAFLASLAD
jgi:osmoprotectant transport system ATP-binding protein